MDSTLLQETLKKILLDVIEKMGFSAEVEVSEEAGDTEPALQCAVRVQGDQHFLIGQHGINLAALQYVVRALFRKQTGERMNIIVDVNGYYADKRALIEKEAEKAAEEALANQISVALRPMLPYERKIAHSYLSKNPSIMTESVGKGEDRKVMVRPRPQA